MFRSRKNAATRVISTGAKSTQISKYNVDISGTKRATKNLRIPNRSNHRGDSFSGPKLQLNVWEHAENGVRMWRDELDVFIFDIFELLFEKLTKIKMIKSVKIVWNVG